MALITDSITYYRSTSYQFQATVVPPDGLSVDTGFFTVKTEPYDSNATDTDAILKKDIAAVSNVCTFTIDPANIPDSVEPGTLNYSIHMLMDDGKIYPFAAGKFYLKATTTNRES